MRKNISKIGMVTVMVMMSSTVFASGVQISVGGAVWSSFWQPAWKNTKSLNRRVLLAYLPTFRPNLQYDLEPKANFTTSPSVMYGGIVSVYFLRRLSLSTVYMRGDFVSRTRKSGISPMLLHDFFAGGSIAFWAPYHKYYVRKISKFDSDTTLSVRLTERVKIYAGFKAQGYDYTERMLYVYSLLGTQYNIERKKRFYDRVRGYGPGVGIGITVPVHKSLFALFNLGGLVLFMKEEVKMPYAYYPYVLDSFGLGYFVSYIVPSSRYISYGGTASAALSYLFDSIGVSLALGGRYQFLYNHQEKDHLRLWANNIAINRIDGKYDHFYGITFSAIYSFSPGRTKEEKEG